MAEAPADPSKRGHLEQKILQVLGDASSPLKSYQLAKECQVLKKELNSVLYRMAKEGTVSQVAPATWRLGTGDPGGVDPTQPAQDSHAQKPQEEAAAAAESPGPQLSELEERIYGFLKASGPCKALRIAQALGMRTAKDVNPTLYKMKSKHLLDQDQKLQVWRVSAPEDSEGRNQSAVAVCQQNPVYMICQNGPNCHITITNSEGIQIGHGNILMKQNVSEGSGPTAPNQLPPTAPGDSSAQGPLAGGWGSQEIHMERSLLRRVQVGHSNEMSFHRDLPEGPAHNLSSSPPVSATAGDGDSEASFETRMPQSDPHPKADAVQRVHIKSCFLEYTTIGNSNRMTVLPAGPETASPGAAAGPGDGRQDPGELKEGADPSSEAEPSTSEVPEDGGQEAPGNPAQLTPKLREMTLGNSNPPAAEHSVSVGGRRELEGGE
ncbi:Z-DNA-binding protein 1 isoform X1 [Marmota marmota marmota]|uniref:Z-DNA-binding protein 1 isoform X1 n=2 Tax=Marmota marmota marmota TaxID=9994 RepID=UPI0007622C78|nr:Z-DNA-binding protein 1 isoform X1 [Marmota marmota marmota]